MRSEADGTTQPWVLQLCHGYDGPFLDCARQYAALFVGTSYKVCTVYLTGSPDEEVALGSASDDVVFLDYASKDIRGLKLDAIRRLRHIVRGRNFHFCIAHRFKPTYIALLATKLPVIGVQHAFGVYKRRSRRLFANFFSKRLVLLGVSDAVRDDVRACLPSWPMNRIETLYNRIDVDALQAEQLSRGEAREFLGVPQDAWVVGNAGRLHPDKDQSSLIRGFAEALPSLPPSSMLLIMGKGRLERDLKNLVIELGLEDHVRFAGQVHNGRRYFKAFDVFVLSSDHEPFGMVLLEAMVAGVPVICSRCGGGPEVLGDAGWLFPFGDSKQLAVCIRQVAQLDLIEKDALHATMRSRLINLFSDDATRTRFWNMQ